MFHRFTRKLLGSACVALLASAAQAEDGWLTHTWDAASSEISSISESGRPEFYAPVWTWHLPYAYDSGQRDRYNNTPQPAFGLGKGRFTDAGNRSSYYALYYMDSNDKWSVNAGYSYEWEYGDQAGLNYGLGLSGGLMTRADYFDRTPFPYLLPTASLGYAALKMETAFVPGAKRGSGNIMFFTLKYEM